MVLNMKKEFDSWNTFKKDMDAKSSKMFCHPREIWWCSLGVNVGFEQNGTGDNFDRPVLVIKGFNEHVFLGVALTGRQKTGKWHFPLGTVDDRQASVVLSQVRIIDTKRLIKKVMTIDQKTFEDLKMALKRALFD